MCMLYIYLQWEHVGQLIKTYREIRGSSNARRDYKRAPTMLSCVSGVGPQGKNKWFFSDCNTPFWLIWGFPEMVVPQKRLFISWQIHAKHGWFGGTPWYCHLGNLHIRRRWFSHISATISMLCRTCPHFCVDEFNADWIRTIVNGASAF